MSYYLADSTGPLDDFASIGGLADFRAWALGQSTNIRKFAKRGYVEAEEFDMLVDELEKASAPGAIDEQRKLLIENTRKAKDVLVISDGANGEPDDGDDLRVAATRMKHPPNLVHDAADRHVRQLTIAIMTAFAEARREVRKSAILRAQSPSAALKTLKNVSVVLNQALRRRLPPVLLMVASDGGQAGLELLRRSLIRTAGGRGSGNFGHSGRPGRVGGSGDSLEESPQEKLAHQAVSSIADTPNRKGEVLTRSLVRLADPKKLRSVEQKERRAINLLKNELLVHGFKKSEPILIKPKGFGRYEIADGFKRLIAARELRLDIIPIRVLKREDLQEFRSAAPQEKGKSHTKVPPFELSFDDIDPNVLKWVKKHSFKLAADLTKTTRENLRDALIEAFEDGDIDEFYGEILDAVGDEARADVIARTEVMSAANAGQRLSWDQAIDAGLLSSNARRMWIATDDRTLCPTCESLDGKTADLDGEYPDEGGEGPPLHPNCRCTEGIVNG